MHNIKKMLTDNRSFIMGIACLWIMLLHCHFETNIYPLHLFCRFGFTQVDTFMFLSGFGLYYSLEKKGRLSNYYKRRLLRVVPPFYFLATAYVIYAVFYKNINILEILQLFTFTSFWQGGNHVFSWFGQMVVFFYIISPIIYYIVKETGTNKGRLVLIMVVAFLIGLMFVNSNLILAMARLSSFVIGMILAHMIENNLLSDKKFSYISLICFIIGMLLLYLIEIMPSISNNNSGEAYSIIFLPLFLLPCGECLVLCRINKVLHINRYSKKLSEFVGIIGHYSFEIYLSQTLLNILFKEILSNRMQNIIISNIARFIIAVFSIILAIVVRKILDLLIYKKKILYRGR